MTVDFYSLIKSAESTIADGKNGFQILKVFAEQINEMEDAYPQRRGMIDTPDGPQHWFDVCLRIFNQREWNKFVMVCFLERSAKISAAPRLFHHLNSVDKITSGLPLSLLASLHGVVSNEGSCIRLNLQQLISKTDVGQFIDFLLDLFGSDPITGASSIREIKADELLLDIGAGFDDVEIASMAKISLPMGLYQRSNSRIYAPALFAALLPKLSASKGVHAVVQGKKLQLLEAMDFINAVNTQKMLTDNRFKPLEPYKEQLMVMANTDEINGALKDIGLAR